MDVGDAVKVYFLQLSYECSALVYSEFARITVLETILDFGKVL